MLKNPSTPASRDLVGSAVSPAEEAPGEGSEIDSSEAALIPARPSPDSRVSYLSDGHEVPIANGGVVPLGPDHQIEVFVAPFPPTDFDVDVDLYLTTSSGVPVPDAEVRVSYDMVFMRHGPYEMVMEDIGGGHYVGSLDMVMFGSWELLTEFTVPDSDDVLELAVTMYVWPV